MSIAPLNPGSIARDADALAFDVEVALRATGYLALPDRKFFWAAPGPRPPDHLGIPDVK